MQTGSSFIGGASASAGAVRITQKTISKGFLVKSIMKLLAKLERSTDLNVNMKFTMILSEFLIKREYQK